MLTPIIEKFAMGILLTHYKGMNFWWIHEPQILGGPNPSTGQLEKLRQAGFTAIISLLDETEQPPAYNVKTTEAMGVTRVSIPLRDFSAPTLENFKSFLAAVEKALGQGKVFVHCQGGSGRTGTMGAAYWVSKGLSVKEAVEKVRQANPKAIETREQENSLHKV